MTVPRLNNLPESVVELLMTLGVCFASYCLSGSAWWIRPTIVFDPRSSISQPSEAKKRPSSSVVISRANWPRSARERGRPCGQDFTANVVRGILREMAHDGMLQFFHADACFHGLRSPSPVRPARQPSNLNHLYGLRNAPLQMSCTSRNRCQSQCLKQGPAWRI